MKVVIKRCFGGFSLSRTAVRALVGKCDHVKLLDPASRYGNVPDWEARWERDRADKSIFGVVEHDGKCVYESHEDGDARACPALIAVVESMGHAADGSFAELAVVDVPDEVKWTISEYDGMERVEEVHRSWP